MITQTTARHPELVSGSIPPLAQVYRRKAQANGQVMPIGVLTLDEVDLPLPAPVLELLLAGDGRRHISEHFISDEPVDFMPRGEALNVPLAVLPKPFDEIAGDTDVKRPVQPACEDVDARVSLNRHAPERDEKWTLKQVQGDETGLKRRHAELVSASIYQQVAEGAGQ